MDIRYSNFKQTWKYAKSLKFKAYLQIIPVWWWGIMFYATIRSFELSIFWFIAQVLVYLFLFINTIFYPWFRLFVSTFKGTRSLFPASLDSGMLSYAKLVCTESIRAYKETDYDRTLHLHDGEFYTTSDSTSKKFASGDILIMNGIFLPIVRFFFLNTIGLGSFILGWIYVPWCFKKVILNSKDSSHD